MNDITEIVAPHDYDAEQALLGYLLVRWDSVPTVRPLLRAEDFADVAHGVIYDAILDAAEQRDLSAMIRQLRDNPALSSLGGSDYLEGLFMNRMDFIDPEGHAIRIRDMAHRRRVQVICDEVSTACVKRPAAECIAQMETALLRVSDGDDETRPRSIGSVVADALQQAEAAYLSDDKLAGVTTGLRDIDRRLGGLRKSDLIILAARPSMGKTALAVNIAVNAAKAGNRVLVFSLEMSAQQLAQRVIAERSGIPADKISRGEVSAAEFDRVVMAGSHFDRLPLVTYDRGAIQAAVVRREARRMQRDKGLDLIVIDYLQLMTPPGGKSDNRVQDVSAITAALKEIAKELDVPVLCLSQLSRQVEQREDKRPQLSDLRDSGSIEQDADVVLFIYREEYYLTRTEPKEGTAAWDAWEQELQRAKGKAEVITAKFRQGATGHDVLRFEGRLTRFSDGAAT